MTVNDTQHSDLVVVNIHVIDINDNDPVFNNGSYHFTVEENLNASAFVNQVFATDIDSDLFGTVIYRLDRSGIGAER